MRWDYDAPFERLLAPSLPEVDAARAAVGGARSGAEAREQLSRSLTSLSRTRQAAIALAADPVGVAAVESLAREHVASLVPWGLEPVDAVAWQFVQATERARQRRIRHDVYGSWVALVVVNGTSAASDWFWPGPEAVRMAKRRGSGPQRVYARDVGAHEVWAHAVEQGAVVRRWTTPTRRDSAGVVHSAVIPEALYGRRFADLADPFTPVLRIWELGYVLTAVTHERIVLTGREVRA